MDKEIRNFNFEIRALENEEHGHFLEGRAIVYGSKYDNGMWDEYIDKGALDNTDLKDVRLLINHDTDMIPLARSRNNNAHSTMQLSKKDAGLDIRADLDIENNATAQALYSATARGDISGMSFMFVVDKDKWEDIDSEHPTRHILSIRKIFEVSAVTFPAYESTTLEAREDQKALDSAKEVLENARNQAEEQRREEQAKLEAIERQKQKIKILSQM